MVYRLLRLIADRMVDGESVSLDDRFYLVKRDGIVRILDASDANALYDLTEENATLVW